MTERTNIAPVRLEIIEAPNAPIRDEDGWEHYPWTLRLSCGDESMRVNWRQGTGITTEPTAADVLESLLMDAAGIENAAGDFEEWAREYGYDEDSRKAERIFQAATKQTEELKDLLGEDFDAAVFPPYNEDDNDPSRSAAERLTAEEPDEDEEEQTYEIVRFRFQQPSEVLRSGVTLEEAQEHCQRDDTRGETPEPWFDGYRAE